MGPVHFQVTNNSGYHLTIRNNPLGTIGEVPSGQAFGYDFDGSIEHNTNQIGKDETRREHADDHNRRGSEEETRHEE